MRQRNRKPHYTAHILLPSPIMAPTQSRENSLFHTERISQYVCIPPSCLSDPFSAVCATVLSPLLLTYFPPAKGVVLAYEDVELSSTPPSVPAAKSHSERVQNNSGSDKESPAEPLLLKHVDEYAAPFSGLLPHSSYGVRFEMHTYKPISPIKRKRTSRSHISTLSPSAFSRKTCLQTGRGIRTRQAR